MKGDWGHVCIPAGRRLPQQTSGSKAEPRRASYYGRPFLAIEVATHPVKILDGSVEQASVLCPVNSKF